jgi:shikimate dehydrogenase
MSETIKTGVIGFPVDHSASPTIHNHWIDEHQINTNRYEKINIDPKLFEEEVLRLKENGTFGFNVTVPLKELAFSFAEEQTKAAKQTRAVNTLTFKKGKVYGDNTDVTGFRRSLDQETVEKSIANKKCLVLGAGGAARAVVCVLNNLNGEVYICNRTFEKALKIQQDLGIQSEIIEQKNLGTVVGEMGFIVNTTSLGLGNTENTMVDFTQVDPQAFVYDLIYNPKLTKFLSDAKEKNLGYQNGIKMLIEQAAESFKIWHNILPKRSEELMNMLEEL